MIKLMGLITRKEGMTVEAFQAYWRDVHAPMIARAPGLRRYVQNHSIAELYDKYPQAFDGIAEAWFDSLEAYEAAVASPAWQEAAVDAPNFIGKSARVMATEVPIIDDFPSVRDRTSMAKYSGFLTRRPHLTVEAFQKHWREVHAPLVVSELTGMVRYVQSHALLETYGSERPPAFDGVPQAWFESVGAFPIGLGRRGNGPPTSPATVDSHNVFVQPIPSLVAREVVIVD
ncbi:MAG TPA: EthD family reductase [Dehalococcoidia bacterium]|nr:EthD family reductase [Dehalococcoidia bacterium]